MFTMKHQFASLFIIAAVIVGCSSNAIRETAYNEPLEPIRLSSDTTIVDVRQYVPRLAQRGIEQDSERVIISECIKTIDYTTENDTCSLVILPNKKHKQALVSAIEGEEEANQVAVRVRFTEPVSDERVVAFVQNIRIPDENIKKQEDDTWLVKIEPRLRGRSVLRIYAENKKTLFNDLFIPLYMGHPMQSGKFYSHLDKQAKVYMINDMDSVQLAKADSSLFPKSKSMIELNEHILNELKMHGAHNTLLHKAQDTTIWQHALVLTLPGVPCIYDKSDVPDDLVSRTQWEMLKKLRNQSMPLMYGEYIPLTVEEDILEFERVYLGNKVRIKLNSKDKSFHIDQ